MNRLPNDPHGDRWLLRARDLLRQQAEQPDPGLQRQLQQRRREVLLAPRPALQAGLPRAALALAASLLVAVVLWQLQALHGGPTSSADALPPLATPALRADSPLGQALTLPEQDLDLLLGEVDYALVEELEFYAWLELQDHDG